MAALLVLGLASGGSAAADVEPPPWTPEPQPTPLVTTPDDASTAPADAGGEDDGPATSTLVIAGSVVVGIAVASVYALRRSGGAPPDEGAR
jgi:hypothetical protein